MQFAFSTPKMNSMIRSLVAILSFQSLVEFLRDVWGHDTVPILYAYLWNAAHSDFNVVVKLYCRAFA